MPTSSRDEIFDPDEVGIYHCSSRCVRRAYLCGSDRYSGHEFGHRRDWIEVRFQQLAAVFMIDILSFAFLDNHFHSMLRNRPDLVQKLSDREVARRSLLLSPNSMPDGVELEEPEEKQIEDALKDSKRIEKWRERLSNLSWFMRYLKEPIARRANLEDGVTGHFWEGRFHSARLLDEYAALMCCIYIDLNEIRAKKAMTLEDSINSSIGLRVRALQEAAHQTGGPIESGGSLHNRSKRVEPSPRWLAPIYIESENHIGAKTMTMERPDRTRKRPSNFGFLDVTIQQYILIVDWIGRCVRDDKRGATPMSLAPVFERLGAKVDSLLVVAKDFGKLFKRFCGSPQQIIAHARKRNAKRVTGLKTAKMHY